MRTRSLFLATKLLICKTVAITLAVTAASAASPQKTHEAVVYAFKGGGDGANPNSLIAGPGGVLYGTTEFGTTPGAASTIFELDPPAVGTASWAKKVLVTFPGPQYLSPISELLRDAGGNLYGVAASQVSDYGTVYRLSPPPLGHSQWTLAILYTFSDVDGGAPAGGLVMDARGALLGTRAGGGAYSAGEVFKLSPPSVGQGTWNKTVLYSFKGGEDGLNPVGHLVLDVAGGLYGMTSYGGSASNFGTVFKLSPPLAGGTQWTESVLHRFGGADGDYPDGSLVADQTGALYGTTYLGGLGSGNLFKLSPPAPGQTIWSETVLHRFGADYDGAAPACGLSIDQQGFLYGTASQSGGYYNAGTAFRLDPPYGSRATYQFAVLHAFDGTLAKVENNTVVYLPSPFDGASPTAPLVPVQTSSGATVLFGVTVKGGTPFNLSNGNGLGVVYEIAP